MRPRRIGHALHESPLEVVPLPVVQQLQWMFTQFANRRAINFDSRVYVL